MIYLLREEEIMKETKPRFLFANPDAPITFITAKLTMTEIEGKLYVFYKHEDGSTMLMLRDQYYDYIDHGLIPEPGKPEDIPGISGKYL